VNFPTASTCADVWRTSDALTWVREPAARWPARHYAGWVEHRGQLFVVGGDSSSGNHQRDVWSSVGGREWKLVCEEAPWPDRKSHLVTSFKGHLYVVGGQTSNAQHVATGDRTGRRMGSGLSADQQSQGRADVWRSLHGDSWEKVADGCPWAPCGMISGANGGLLVHNSRLWILGGGFVGDGGGLPDSRKSMRPGLAESRLHSNAVWSSADGVQWECVCESAPWRGRHYHGIHTRPCLYDTTHTCHIHRANLTGRGADVDVASWTAACG
jgi:hypothetical protein